MENKLIVSIESYGIKHTTEVGSDVDSDVFAEIVFNLMCCVGYNRDNIIDSFKHIIRVNDDN